MTTHSSSALGRKAGLISPLGDFLTCISCSNRLACCSRIYSDFRAKSWYCLFSVFCRIFISRKSAFLYTDGRDGSAIRSRNCSECTAERGTQIYMYATHLGRGIHFSEKVRASSNYDFLFPQRHSEKYHNAFGGKLPGMEYDRKVPCKLSSIHAAKATENPPEGIHGIVHLHGVGQSEGELVVATAAGVVQQSGHGAQRLALHEAVVEEPVLLMPSPVAGVSPLAVQPVGDAPAHRSPLARGFGPLHGGRRTDDLLALWKEVGAGDAARRAALEEVGRGQVGGAHEIQGGQVSQSVQRNGRRQGLTQIPGRLRFG